MMKLVRGQECYSTDRMSCARLQLLLNVISDQIAAEAQLTEKESIEFSSDITIILSHVYKHAWKMLQDYHLFEKFSALRESLNERSVKSCYLIRLP